VSVMDDVINESMGLSPVTEKRYDDVKHRYDEPDSPGRGRTREYTKRTVAHRSRSRGVPGPAGPLRNNTGFVQRAGWSKRELHEGGGTW
jgi:hypothetical protein